MNSPQLPSPSAEPRTPAQGLNRDQRVQVRTLAKEGYSYKRISERLGFTYRQVCYTMSVENVELQFSSGRPPSLSSSQVDQIESFICLSSQNRQISFFELAHFAFKHFGVSEFVDKRELKKQGYAPRLPRLKPFLSSYNKLKRYEFARRHLHWQKQHWMRALWSDETWVLDGRRGNCWVTRKVNEAYHSTCVSPKTGKKVGWMFWGSFFGRQKGPFLFWEKEWGSITAAGYSERIVPLIDSVASQEPGLLVMQDNAPPHKAGLTMREFERRNISPIEWPPYSSNLNPIESVWDYMKDYIDSHHPQVVLGRRQSLQEFRVIVSEAWDLGFNGDDLEHLIESMSRRVRGVYEAEGGYVYY